MSSSRAPAGPVRTGVPAPARAPRGTLRSLRERPLPLHPLLFAAFPALLLYASNVREQIQVADVFIALGVLVGSAALLLVAATAALGDARRGALLVSLWLALFFGYGGAWRLARSAGGVGSEGWMLAGWALLAAGAVVVASRAGRWLAGATRGLNAAAIVLVALNLITVAIGIASGGQDVEMPGATPSLRAGDDPPDIYYLVMDRYGAAETLQERFGFDNAPFLDALRERGFYVADESTANYPKTSHSLAASLNMGYLGFLTEVAGRGSDDWDPVYDLLRGFRVADALQSSGYRYVHVGSRWGPTRIDPAADVNEVSSGVSEFAQALYGSTLLGPLSRYSGVFAESLDPLERERRRTLFQFERLAAAQELPGPTFVFGHVLLPHEPYIFEPDGGRVTEVEEAARPLARKFIDQVRFANRKLLELIDALLSEPPEERPVILLQADEGPHPPGYLAHHVDYDWTEASDAALEQKLRILNAYYLPGITDAGPAAVAPIGPSRATLYPSISPVNSFRVVFNAYFDAGLTLLPDRSYVFVDERHLYDFVDVTGGLRGS
jgi:hypothetical protein